MIRGGIAAGAAVGFLVAVFVVVGGGGGSKAVNLTARPVSAKVLAPTVKYRTSSGADPQELGTDDTLKEKAVI
jgi:hypothetical protein